MTEVQRASPALWEAVKRTRLRALADSPHAFGSTLAREREFDDEEWQRRTARIDWWLAWSAGRPVGIAAMVIVEGSTDQRHLVAMWVEPGQRGTGVASDLVEAVCDQARAEDATTVTLWVADHNPRAQRFYAKCGFRMTGEYQPLPSAPEVGEALMIRALRPRTFG